MVLGLQSLKRGLVNGMKLNTQLNTQAAAVIAVAYTGSGAIGPADSVVDLNKAGGTLVMTIAGGFDVGRILVITQIDAGSNSHTVTLPSSTTFDGTNNIATFGTQYQALVLLCISQKRFLILKNYGSVTLST